MRLSISIPALALLGCALASAPALCEEAGGGVAIRFVTADGHDVTYPSESSTILGEASFSVPRPVVVLDELIFGDPSDDPANTGNTVIEQVGADQFRLKVSGTVYGLLADVVADGKADIKEVALTSGMFGLLTTAVVEPVASDDQPDSQHPLARDFAHLSGLEDALRPFPFRGRFVSEVVTVPIGTGYNMIAVSATSTTGREATSLVEIRATVNREAMRYDLVAEVANQVELGLFNPVLVMIDDPSVTEATVADARATVNGIEVGLRFIDGRLQLDRPLLGLDRAPAGDIPNLVAVIGSPNSFLIEYRGVRAELGWSYTASN